MNVPSGPFRRILTILALFAIPILNVSAFEEPDHEGEEGHSLTHNQIKRGKRLFYGLIHIGEDAASCTDCHYTRELDTINWFPSAMDIAVTSLDKSLEEFTADLLNPEGIMMSEVHQNYDISADDIAMIKAWLAEFNDEGLTAQKPAIGQRVLYILALLLIFAAITDLAVTRKIPFRFVHGLVILASLFYVVEVTVKEAIAVGRSPGYAPDQPIKFSHKIHAGQNQIDCLYCHNTADHGKSAGIPSANV